MVTHDVHDPQAIRIALGAIALAQVSTCLPDATFDAYRLARVTRDVRGAFSRGDLVLARRAGTAAVAWSRQRASDVALSDADLAWLEVA